MFLRLLSYNLSRRTLHASSCPLQITNIADADYLKQVTIFEIAKLFKEGKDDEMYAKLDTLTTLMSLIQPKELKDEYNTLYAEDVKNHSITSEDPTLDPMIERHKKAVANAGVELGS